MPSLFTQTSKEANSSPSLTKGEKEAVVYHTIFDYPLSFADLIKWKANDESITSNKSITGITSKNGYYFIDGKEPTIYKRKLNKRISQRKLVIAKKAADILSFLPTVKMIGITGSLAMENSNEESDIDLIIITSAGNMWTTRLFAYLLICLFRIQKRSPTDHSQKDKLCLNMWLDESDLVWSKKDRNLYTAHEVAQIVPLINKNKTYEKFLMQNKWILNFWPNSVKFENWKFNENWQMKIDKFNFLEKVCYWIQKKYMEKKITREIITPTRALFHPHDWGKVVMQRLAS